MQMNELDKKYNIVYSSSDTYARCTGISILSLLENNKLLSNIVIYLFINNMSNENLNKIFQVTNKYNVELNIIDVEPKLTEIVKEYNLPTLSGSYNSYVRIFASNWISNIDSALFIDSDTLILDSIEDIFLDDINENVISAVPDIGVYHKRIEFEDREILDNQIYFNAGILKINFKKWREYNTDFLIIKALNEYKKQWINQDQSILNYALKNICSYLPFKYNFYTLFHSGDYEKIKKDFHIEKFLSKNEYDLIRFKPAIIHFVGSNYTRPWFRKSVSVYKKIYLKYNLLSPWGNISLEKMRNNSQFTYRLYDYLLYITIKYNLRFTNYVLKRFFGEFLKEALQSKIGNRK